MTELMGKLETLVRARFPNSRIVSPTAAELFLQKWGNFAVDPQTGTVVDPTVAVQVQLPEQSGVPASLRQRTLMVDLHQGAIVAETG
jgi:hypothetical protein